MTTPSVALVIGSGSVKCAAALGLARVLQREGIALSHVVGCSGGSIYAAGLALGHGVDDTVEATKKLWTREVTSVKNRRNLLAILFPKTFGFSAEWGLRDDRLVMKSLEERYRDTRLEDAKIPLFITATDFENGDQVVLSKGRIVDALRASIAIPFVFPPWKVDGKLLADGYLSDPLPINVAIREGANVILAMGFESPYQGKIDSAGRFAFQVSSILSNNLLKSRYAFHNIAHHTDVMLVLPEFKERVKLFDTDKIPYIIEEGARATEALLPHLRRLLADVG